MSINYSIKEYATKSPITVCSERVSECIRANPVRKLKALNMGEHNTRAASSSLSLSMCVYQF